MKINFEKNENGCFTDNNIITYSLNEKVVAEQVLEELANMTFRSLHDIYEEQNLFIVVTSTDDEGNVCHEILRSMLTHVGDCPLDNGVFVTIDGRMYEATEPDFVFTDFDEAKKFLEDLIYVKESSDRLEATVHLLALTDVFIKATDNPEDLRKLNDLKSKMETSCEEIVNSTSVRAAVNNVRKYIPE